MIKNMINSCVVNSTITNELNKSDYKILAISMENFKEFYKNKDAEGYYNFFKKNYLNNNIEKINLYDPINLILQSKKKFNDIKIDVGVNDEFIKDLYIKDFKDACTKVGQKLSIQMHEGYDHGYYFIHSFIEDHIKFHATAFKNL